jgi:hypothetical protein
VTGVLAVFTYRQARRTIFTPFRTEAFKLQLKAFEDVLLFFEKHPTTNIDDEFDFDTIVRLNALKLLDAYTVHFFRSQVDVEKLKAVRKDVYKPLVGAVISRDFVEKYFEKPAPIRTEPKDEPPQADINPAIVFAQWQEYTHGMIEFTKRHQKASERVRRFRVSPLMPSELKNRIGSFEDVVGRNLYAVGDLLTEFAKELPDKYPTLASLDKADLSWVWNQYNRRREPLGEKQNAILSFVTDYLQIDKLLTPDA